MSGKEPNQLELSSHSISYSGPLPTSSEFEGYERALPGAADRILAMCEKQVDHRHKNENEKLDRSIKLEGRGQIFAFILSILSIGVIVVSIIFSQPVFSIAATLIIITGIASLFSNSNKKDKK